MSNHGDVPKDRVDLFLAPVALAVNEWLDGLTGLPDAELGFRLVLSTNMEPRNSAAREQALVRALRQEVDLHGWDATIASRGLRLNHESRELVLGLPENVAAYLSSNTNRPA